jgi:AraC-like DNA-binding protein
MRPADANFFRYFPAGGRDRRWGLYVSGAGSTQISPAWTDYPKRVHPDAYMFGWERGRVLQEYQALYMLRGHGEFESATAGHLRVAPGTVILLFPGDWHRYRPDKKTGWDEYWVSFGGRHMDQLVRDDFFSPERPLLEIGTDERVLQQYLDLLDLGREEPIGFQQLAAARVHGILAGALAAVRRGEGSQQDEERVRQAKAYLEQRVEGTVSMPKLAAELCMSLRQLERVFRRATGMTPHEFYRQLKMRRAQQLLGTDLPLKAVANQLGFESQFHFSRTFKKHFGLPPSQWRGG